MLSFNRGDFEKFTQYVKDGTYFTVCRVVDSFRYNSFVQEKSNRSWTLSTPSMTYSRHTSGS